MRHVARTHFNLFTFNYILIRSPHEKYYFEDPCIDGTITRKIKLWTELKFVEEEGCFI